MRPQPALAERELRLVISKATVLSILTITGAGSSWSVMAG
jgi:hypothetical protein